MTRLAFSPDEAAESTGLGRTFIFAEIKKGKLIARKAGRRTVIAAADLSAYLAGLPPAGDNEPHAA